MNLIERIKRRWTQAPDRAAGEMPSLYGNSPRLDPVRYIARMCAGEELKLYKKSDRRINGKNAEPVGEHEIYEVLENPCPTFPEIDGWTLRYLTFAYIDLVAGQQKHPQLPVTAQGQSKSVPESAAASGCGCGNTHQESSFGVFGTI